MRFSPDHDPALFSLTEIAEIEKAWQYAAVALSHYRLHDMFSMDLDNEQDDDDDETPILTLSRHSRHVTPQIYADRTDIVAEAARNDVRCLCWASPRLRRDKQFVSMIVRQHLAKQEQNCSWQEQSLSSSHSDDSATCHKATSAVILVPPPVQSHSLAAGRSVPHSPKLLFTGRLRGVHKQRFSLPRTLRLPGRQ